jgi:hypothetical protein
MPFRGIILGKSKLSADYTAERHAFPRYNPRRACNCELFCVKAGFPMVKSAESFDFPRIILQKGMPFRRVIYGKSKLSVNYPAERFSIPRKVKISLFKGISLLPQIILDKKSTLGDQYYPRFERKTEKTWCN